MSKIVLIMSKIVHLLFAPFFRFRYRFCMESNYVRELKNTLSNLLELRKNAASRLEELSDCRDLCLKTNWSRGRRYYSAKRKGDSKKWYLGGDSSEQVQRIREYRYVNQMIRDADAEIRNLERFLRSHIDVEYDAINSRLPDIYRDRDNISLQGKLSDERIKQWKCECESRKATYPVKNPENLKMHAIDGTPMRSKSEVIIANLLISNGIPYVYELPHVIEGVTIYIDFTMLSFCDYKEVMLEHEGLMYDANYQRVFLRKVNTFLAADIIPGKDVYFTFDDLHGGFDPMPVQHIIDSRLKPRPGDRG